MISVQEAEQIILSQVKDRGTETIPFQHALGRVLAADLLCDRDMPGYDRVSMDGIAIQFDVFERGITSFNIKGIQAAGDTPLAIGQDDECIEIMTGAALSPTTDTIVPYEHLVIDNGVATVHTPPVKKGQNIHFKGTDKLEGDIAVQAGIVVDATVINVAATVGQTMLTVKKLPRVLIASTGDELVDVNDTPTPYQIRRSNNYTLNAVLQRYGIQADMLHLADNETEIEREMKRCLVSYDVLLLSGGVSMGKYDHLPVVLERLGVHKLFHKVRQRPGKPFWFGSCNDALVFAFPGNPVSVFMCLHRYFLPWLDKSLGISENRKMYAVLTEDLIFTPQLQYFLQVKTGYNEQAQITATPVPGNGSGDLANLVESDAFLELPLEKNEFKKGEVYRLWPFKRPI